MTLKASEEQVLYAKILNAGIAETTEVKYYISVIYTYKEMLREVLNESN